MRPERSPLLAGKRATIGTEETLAVSVYPSQPRPSRPLTDHRVPPARALFAQTAKGWLPVGRIVQRGGQRVLVKTVDSRKHQLQRPPGYALEVQTLEQAARLGVSRVEIQEEDTGRSLSASIADFWEKGKPIQRGGFAPQRALPLAYWAINSPCQPQLFFGGRP